MHHTFLGIISYFLCLHKWYANGRFNECERKFANPTRKFRNNPKFPIDSVTANFSGTRRGPLGD